MIRNVTHALLVSLSLVLAGVTAGHALDAADLPKAIEGAKTSADHEAIAAYFDAQAKQARETAASHEQMGAVYKKRPPVSPKGGSHAFHDSMGDHCDALVSKYEQAAEDYEEMAAAHRAEAKAAR